MVNSVSHYTLTNDSNISRMAEGQRADIGQRLIWDAIQILSSFVVFIMFLICNSFMF